MPNLYGETDPSVEVTVSSHEDLLHTDFKIRCTGCRKLLIEMATRPWRVVCVRCKKVNQSIK